MALGLVGKFTLQCAIVSLAQEEIVLIQKQMNLHDDHGSPATPAVSDGQDAKSFEFGGSLTSQGRSAPGTQDRLDTHTAKATAAVRRPRPPSLVSEGGHMAMRAGFYDLVVTINKAVVSNSIEGDTPDPVVQVSDEHGQKYLTSQKGDNVIADWSDNEAKDKTFTFCGRFDWDQNLQFLIFDVVDNDRDYADLFVAGLPTVDRSTVEWSYDDYTFIGTQTLVLKTSAVKNILGHVIRPSSDLFGENPHQDLLLSFDNVVSLNVSLEKYVDTPAPGCEQMVLNVTVENGWGFEDMDGGWDPEVYISVSTNLERGGQTWFETDWRQDGGPDRTSTPVWNHHGLVTYTTGDTLTFTAYDDQGLSNNGDVPNVELGSYTFQARQIQMMDGDFDGSIQLSGWNHHQKGTEDNEFIKVKIVRL